MKGAAGRSKSRLVAAIAVIAGGHLAGGHLAGASTVPEPGESVAPVTEGKWCSLHLHWAGGNGQADAAEEDQGGYWKLWPSSPAGAFWEYDGPHDYAVDPETGDEEYQAIVEFLTGYLDERDCGPVLVVGYSNGGGLAAKLLCQGEDFGGRAWGFIVDDPVMDDGVLECEPSPLVRHVLFTHSEELVADAEAANGDCSVTGWYCEDNHTMPLADYEAATGYPSQLQREFHGGDGWSDDELAPWHTEYLAWTTVFESASVPATTG
ncbi:hypothetical protein [Desertimonas flava]|uniref:hypothetical protein n=1 Tax=Desertimonas flava TaxID=2064846 RepID=UPI0013C44BF7|nr:hypothetical protein [Desertimonas flava]